MHQKLVTLSNIGSIFNFNEYSALIPSEIRGYTSALVTLLSKSTEGKLGGEEFRKAFLSLEALDTSKRDLVMQALKVSPNYATCSEGYSYIPAKWIPKLQGSYGFCLAPEALLKEVLCNDDYYEHITNPSYKYYFPYAAISYGESVSILEATSSVKEVSRYTKQYLNSSYNLNHACLLLQIENNIPSFSRITDSYGFIRDCYDMVHSKDVIAYYEVFVAPIIKVTNTSRYMLLAGSSDVAIERPTKIFELTTKGDIHEARY
jgi:hypothetical protein